jgi:V8-like Glu-specific endopeptidase
MTKYILIILTIFYGNFLFAQISEGGLPVSWKESIPANNISYYLLPDAGETPKNINADKHGSFVFAKVIEFNKDIKKAGTHIKLPNGDNLWQIKIKSAGAYSLNLTFSRFLIPDRAEVFIYTPGKMRKLGAFTSKNNKPFGSLSVAPIQGDEIIIEYYEPEDVDFNGELIIGDIGHDFLNIFTHKDGQYGASGDCNIDVNCPEGADWKKQKRAVCRLIINNNLLCTGVLVNNTNNDKTPYILSANHCIDNNNAAQHTVFVFNYESPSCNGPDGSVEQSISGAELIATKNRGQGFLDFTLLKLSSDVPISYKPFFAGWDSRTNQPQAGTCIHHPWGDVKKISQDYDSPDVSTYLGWGYDPQSFWRINYWDKGTTEGGSSGSPLFNQDKRVVGTLTGGEASCETDSCDYFQMFAVCYDKYSTDTLQLKHWLDPNNTGAEFIDGLDTESQETEIADLINVTHWSEGQDLALYTANDGGYLAGNNAYQDKAKAEFFNKIEFGNRNAVTGAYIAFGYATGNNEQQIELQVIKDNMGIPTSTILGSAFASLGEIKDKADKDYVYYKFEPPVEVNSSIYLSVVLPQVEGDTIALMTVEEADINTAWELNRNDEWRPYSDPDNSWGVKLSHLIALEIGRFTAINEKSANNDFNIYPNPADDAINITTNKNTAISNISIYNNLGIKVINIADVNYYNYSINLSSLNPGLYFITISSENQVFSKPFIKR